MGFKAEYRLWRNFLPAAALLALACFCAPVSAAPMQSISIGRPPSYAKDSGGTSGTVVTGELADDESGETGAASGDAVDAGPASSGENNSADGAENAAQPGSGAGAANESPDADHTPIPGKLTADSISYASDGTVVAVGHVVLESPNLLPDSAIRLTTEKLTYSRATGKIETEGAVTVELLDMGATLHGNGLVYSVADKTGTLTGVSGSLPIDRGPGFPLVHIFILEGNLTLDAATGKTRLFLHQAKLSTYPYDDTDFYIQVKRVDFAAGDYIKLVKMSANASGYRIFYWPYYRDSLIKQAGPMKSLFPLIGFSGDDGMRVFYQPEYTVGPVTTQFNFDYWTERGLLAEANHYVEWGDFKLGVREGEVWSKDVNGDTAIYKERLNGYADYDADLKKGVFQKLKAHAEYGKIKQELPDLTGERAMASVTLGFRDVPLGGAAFFGTTAGVSYFRYNNLPSDEYTQCTLAGTLGRRKLLGTDKIEVRWHPKQGAPAFRFDNRVNELEAAATKHVRLSRKWMAVGTVLYDFDHHEFDQLSIELRRINKGYTIGVAWDMSLGAAYLTMDVRWW